MTVLVSGVAATPALLMQVYRNLYVPGTPRSTVSLFTLTLPLLPMQRGTERQKGRETERRSSHANKEELR